MKEIRTPTLVVGGNRDEPDIQETAKKLTGDIPDARLVSIADAGHLANMEAPAPFNEILLGFLGAT